MEEGAYAETVSGTPQGGVISPLLSNIYLHYLDAVWEHRCGHVGKLVRYADDFVVLCRTAEDVGEAERRVRIIFERLKLTLHPEKTRRVDLTGGKASTSWAVTCACGCRGGCWRGAAFGAITSSAGPRSVA